MAGYEAFSSTTILRLCCLSALCAAVLLEVPPWRSQPGAPGALSSSAPGSSGSVHCVDDPHTRVLFAAQEQARDATTKLGAHAAVGCVCSHHRCAGQR